jgi:hypothetical protein
VDCADDVEQAPGERRDAGGHRDRDTPIELTPAAGAHQFGAGQREVDKDGIVVAHHHSGDGDCQEHEGGDAAASFDGTLPGYEREAAESEFQSVGAGFGGVGEGVGDDGEEEGAEADEDALAARNEGEQAEAEDPEAQHGGQAGCDFAEAEASDGEVGGDVRKGRIDVGEVGGFPGRGKVGLAGGDEGDDFVVPEGAGGGASGGSNGVDSGEADQQEVLAAFDEGGHLLRFGGEHLS